MELRFMKGNGCVENCSVPNVSTAGYNIYYAHFQPSVCKHCLTNTITVENSNLPVRQKFQVFEESDLIR